MSGHRKYCSSLICRNTFGVGVVDSKGRILANEKSVYVPPKGRGMIPSKVAEHHTRNAKKVLKSTLNKAKLKIKDMDIIAVALGAGLPPCLRIGTALAHYLALKYNKPLVRVCHQVAHIEIGRLTTTCKDPVVLYLSGGNTQVIAFADGKYRIFGETLDIAIGNAIDNLARELGLPFPYGPNFDKIAAKGKRYIELPYVVKGMDSSFSGLLTTAVKKYKAGASKADICYSFQETCFAMLAEVAERALAHTGKNELLLVGGVAASKRLQTMLWVMCKERGAKLYVVPKEYSGDQGVMIAWTGVLAYKNGQTTKIEDSSIRQKWRTDEVEIPWI